MQGWRACVSARTQISDNFQKFFSVWNREFY